MNIAEVKIKNFRCFKELNLSLEHCHAFVGENGSGKTSIIEAINMATSAGQPHLSEDDFNNADLGDISIEVIFDKVFLTRIPDGYTTQDIPCKSVVLNAHRREKAAPGKALSDPIVVNKYAVPLEYDDQHTPSFSSSVTVRIPTAIMKTESGWESPRKTTANSFKFTANRLTLQNDMVKYPNVFYFDRGREGQARVGYNSLLQKIAKDLNWRYRKDWISTEIESKWNAFYEAVISTVEDPKSGRIIQPIRDKLKQIAGVEFGDLELGLLEIEQPFSKTFFSRRCGTNQIDQKHFGSGISILLAYFLLYTISELSKEDIIFLIDEPELHLHPQLQQVIFREFQSSEFQTIYTTQSDCLISVAEWQSVSIFRLDFTVEPQRQNLSQKLEDKEITYHLNEIKKWHQHQSVFFREDNQIFFARKCLLVEGPAEKYGLPVLAKILKKKIDSVTIISCNGKTKIPYYQLLCKAFKIPYFTLFDLDGKRADEENNKRPNEWAEIDARSTMSTSFENQFNVSSGADHKTSELLVKIDNIKNSDIPTEVVNAITAIEQWALKD